jgi:tetratricopeptide (TPR) repeat protein
MKSLTPECVELLKHAAILGGAFDFSVICMMETDLHDANDDRVLSLLEEAQDADVVLEEESGSRIVYHFWHPLVTSHLYDKLSAVRRMRWHKKAAEAILQLNKGREEVAAAQVVLHLDKAGDDKLRIAHYAELAGDNAFALPAYAEAEAYYQLAIECLEQAHVADGQPHLLSLLERLGECAKNSGSYEKATEVYMRLLALRRQIPVVADPRTEAQIQALLWDETCWTWRYRGDIQRAWECCQQGEEILRRAQVEDGPARARLFYTRSNLYLSEGQYEQALKYAQESLTLFAAQPTLVHGQSDESSRKLGKTLIQRTLDGDPVNLGRLHRHMGGIAVGKGQLQLALEHQMTALKSFEQYNELRQVGNILSNIGFIQLKMGQYEEARKSLQRALDHARRINDGPLTSLVISNLGELYAVTGQLDEAKKEYVRALKLNGNFGDREYMSRWQAGLASILLEQGNLNEAALHINKALIVARKMKNQPCLGQALVVLANLRVAQANTLPAGSEKRAIFLAHAQRNVQRALSLKIEAETRRKGELALARIAFELGDADTVQKLCTGLVVAAQDYVQIVAGARQLLARMS